MKKILHYINSLPFSFTMKHFQTFGDSASSLKDNSLNNVESWDALRESHPNFSIGETREGWLKASELKVKKDGQDSDLPQRARDIVNLLIRENISSIFSVGVGGAGLEYQIIKINPALPVVCSEYSPKTVSKLKAVFTEAKDVVVFDILNGSWNEIKDKFLRDDNSLLLMYRLDAGFTDEEWRKIFESMSDAGIERVLYIPTTLLTLLSIWNRKRRELKWFLGKMPVSFAGYLRSKRVFQTFWAGLYREESLTLGGLKGFYLKKKS